MDEDNMKSWASQPDVCRCCLSANGTLDLCATYITEAGSKEVFSEMLQECYGISLSYLTEWGPSRLVCELCAGHLRDACSFKVQVLRAEQCFIQHCCEKETLAVKIEELNTSDGELYHEGSNSLNGHSPTKPDSKDTKTHRKRQKIKPKRKKKDIEYDSDVPIAELKKDEPRDLDPKDGNLLDSQDIKCKTEFEIKCCEDNVDISCKGKTDTQVNSKKQISERKRVIITCAIVLLETTACPFRHHKSWFQCFYCTQDFMEINLLRTHTNESHHDITGELNKMKRYPRSLQIEISNLECRHCNVTLTDVEIMRRHFECVHNKVIYKECLADYKVDSSPFSCHLCSKEFHVFRTLTTHLNEHYANCICDECGRSFLNSKRLKVHKRTHEKGLFPCGQCDKVLKSKSSQANHMESAHSRRILKCQICFKPMKHYNDRIKHMSEAHNITHNFKCHICCKEYNIKHYLATHIRQTHGSKNKKCNKCGMAFITNHGLKKHMVIHTGLKPFSCSICSKSYARNYTLREHLKCHANVCK